MIKRVIYTYSNIDDSGNYTDFADYERVDDKMVLRYCNFGPHCFDEEMTIEDFEVEFSFDEVLILEENKNEN